MKAAIVAAEEKEKKIMSYIITSAELEGLTEQQLRAKRYAIVSELVAKGLSLQDCPHIAISLRIIDEAIARLRRFPQPRF